MQDLPHRSTLIDTLQISFTSIFHFKHLHTLLLLAIIFLCCLILEFLDVPQTCIAYRYIDGILSHLQFIHFQRVFSCVFFAVCMFVRVAVAD